MADPTGGGGDAASPTTYVWKVPEGWGTAGREAVLKAHEGEDIHPDYLPPTDEEVAIMQNLAEGVADLKSAESELDDVTLLRFVRGFTLNEWGKLPIAEATSKTVEVLRRALEFYEHVGASTIVSRKIDRSYEYHKYWVNGTVGTDTFGRQIYLVHPPGSRLIKQFKGSEDLVLNHVFDLERLKKSKRAEEAKRAKGLLLYKHVMIFDGGITSITMERIMFMKNALDFNGTNIDSDFYPEMLYRAWVINAPLALRAIWKVASIFLSPITRAKFQFFGNVPLDKMAEDGLTLDNLPLYLGGNAPNPPGFHYKEVIKAGKTFERKWPVKKGDNFMWDIEMKSSYYVDVKLLLGGREIAATRIDEKTGVLCTGNATADADGELTLTMYNDGRWSSRTVSYDVRINE